MMGWHTFLQQKKEQRGLVIANVVSAALLELLWSVYCAELNQLSVRLCAGVFVTCSSVSVLNDTVEGENAIASLHAAARTWSSGLDEYIHIVLADVTPCPLVHKTTLTRTSNIVAAQCNARRGYANSRHQRSFCFWRPIGEVHVLVNCSEFLLIWSSATTE